MSQTAVTSPRNGLKGLSIERRFSTPGVQPFDQVEWEIRDAVIGNPESPAFEQRGHQLVVRYRHENDGDAKVLVLEPLVEIVLEQFEGIRDEPARRASVDENEVLE